MINVLGNIPAWLWVIIALSFVGGIAQGLEKNKNAKNLDKIAKIAESMEVTKIKGDK